MKCIQLIQEKHYSQCEVLFGRVFIEYIRMHSFTGNREGSLSEDKNREEMMHFVLETQNSEKGEEKQVRKLCMKWEPSTFFSNYDNFSKMNLKIPVSPGLRAQNGSITHKTPGYQILTIF